FLDKITRLVKVPLMIDSTDAAVMERALTWCQGKGILNSINLEDGLERFEKVLPLAKRYGAALVVGLIDERGMAVTVERKMEVAHRSYRILTEDWGIPPEDLWFDPLVFPCGTGDEAYLGSAKATIEAVRRIDQELPLSKTILGISNVSFGLPGAGREVLNSVFLYHNTKAGLDAAIVNTEKLARYAEIPAEERALAERLLELDLGDAEAGQAAVDAFAAHFRGKKSALETRQPRSELELAERLARAVVEGSKEGLIEDLDLALADERWPQPLDIINGPLMAGMAEVGRLFNDNELIVAEVLQSAEVMKAAVGYLERFMEKAEGAASSSRGKVILATVKGDVHDIGKNLVDIILTNNGYEVVNLGIKQPITTILDAAAEHRADAIGMSGLLVKSTVVMKENLAEMNSRGVAARWPVLLGGAALTRAYVENDLTEMYLGDVRYARDAFEGLRLMDAIMAAKRGEPAAVDPEAGAKAAERRARRERSLRIAAERRAKAEAQETAPVPARSSVAVDVPIPTPPFWGSRVVKGIPVADYAALLDERATFMGQWGLRGARGGGPTYEELVETEGRPRLRYWMDRLTTEGVLAHAAVVYGYFPCVAEGDDLVVLREPRPDAAERLRFTFPRQRRDRRLCLADFWRQRDAAVREGVVDVVAFHLVTMGQPIADYANELFGKDAYREYLEVHGLGVQLTEALAEHWHRRVREELRWPDGGPVSAEDPADVEQFFKLGYRGARYSFGYGACPEMEDRAKVVELLEPDRIGVVLSEELQLHPEQSTDAFVAHHPEAKYFNV
ncbi:dihydropteroate synthase, partial [Umezawaea sp.]|uniref:dihydropteroate synthase n=1 Tax=Umezawaea sp. TaxID=1955258 RepID=UPI002ED3D527